MSGDLYSYASRRANAKRFIAQAAKELGGTGIDTAALHSALLMALNEHAPKAGPSKREESTQ